MHRPGVELSRSKVRRRNHYTTKLQITHQYNECVLYQIRFFIDAIWPSTATSTCLLVNHPTTSGNAAWVDPERDGSTRSERTTESPRRTCGGERRVVVTEDQRYSPGAGYAIAMTIWHYEKMISAVHARVIPLK